MYASLPDYANAEVMHQHHHHHHHQHPHQHPYHSQQRQCHDVAAKSARKQSNSTSSSCDGDGGGDRGGGGGELDERAGRFASALLLLAALVLAVDATRVAMYSWYSEGSYLHFTYGDRDSVTWPRCGAAAVPPPLPQPSLPPPPAAARVAASSAAPPLPSLRQTAEGGDEGWLSGARGSLVTGVLLAGEALGAGLLRTQPRPPPKPLAVGLSHASPAACVCLLLTALLPACLRSAPPSRCALAAAVVFAVASVSLAAMSVAACIVKIYFFTLCEIAPPRPAPMFSYADFVPPCPLLRKAFFCAECFSLLVLIAAACMAVCLMAFYSRALCCRTATTSGRRRPPGSSRRCYGNSRDYGCRDVGDVAGERYGDGESFPV